MSTPTDLAEPRALAPEPVLATTAARRRLVAVAGSPNSGKSTLFNRLTGLRQKVANYPGVTVEKRVGRSTLPSGRMVDVLDLPGAYSLRPASPDERIVRDVLLGIHGDTRAPDLVLFVLDATHLDRQLYLALQVLELGRPTIIALNMIDAAEEEEIVIDARVLERALGVPVFAVSAKRGRGLDRLKSAMDGDLPPPPVLERRAPPAVEAEITRLCELLPSRGPLTQIRRGHFAMALLLDDGEDDAIGRSIPESAAREIPAARSRLDRTEPEWRGREAVGHYEAIEGLVAKAVRRARAKPDTVRSRIDRVVTHRVLGPLLFVGAMALVFQSIFTWAQPAMDLIDAAFQTVGRGVGSLLPAGPLRSLIVDGVIAGAGTVMMFVPQIAILFFFISLMEDTGYMARAAFIMDRLMRAVGLPGRAFIPLLSSFACAIPGIMATRTIDNRRDRFTTILIAPFMSCSARLPVYALLIGAFIPNRTVLGILSLPGLTLFALYFMGIVAAIAVAWLLRRSVLRGGRPLYVMELPPYRVPSWRSILLTVRDRAGLFLQKAGTVIVAVSIVLWFLASYPRGHAETRALEGRLHAVETAGDASGAATLKSEIAGSNLRHSFAGQAGRLLEPAIAPLGFDWKIGIALLTSFAAREVMVSTMATVYNLEDTEAGSSSLREKLRHARDPGTGRPSYTPLVALSLMVFFMLACQCMSTVAVVRRETNSWRWPILMVLLMNGLAWGASLVVFQGGRALGLG